jgi:anti-sigma factor RsiW
VRCSSCEPLLAAYLEGARRPRQLLAVAAHLRGCRACSGFLHELRVVDALLETTRSPEVDAGFTAAVVSATDVTPPQTTRRVPLWLPFLLYLVFAWVLIVLAATRSDDVVRFVATFAAVVQNNLAALAAAVRAVAPATPLAAAAVTGILLLDLLLLGAIFYGYRRVRPLLALYLARGQRS